MSKWKKVKGDGNITTMIKITEDYQGLRASGPMHIKLVSGSEGEITIKGDSNLMEYLITEVQNNILVVKTEDGYNLGPTDKIFVTVPYETINSITLAGSGDITSKEIITSNDFKISLSGSGDIELNIESSTIDSSIAGSGNIELNGATNQLHTKVTGSGNFNGNGLKTSDVDASISGSGNINVTCIGQLKARVTGSGNITYKGNPQSTDTKVTGSGNIKG
ncbi:head GIN domain-containing protein [Winogradskyella ursingii]|uniref:head GIN domain-containing protein n=1 Tax=Winogradskyella ursingii TaxID=2686079 RepID=UPI001FEBA2A8|nr:head GIN domain-containing protein [Winogradskyella ursingii]